MKCSNISSLYNGNLILNARIAREQMARDRD